MGTDPGRIADRSDLHEALAGLREAAGLSYQELATEAGTVPATVHGMCAGTAFPRWSTLQPVLAVLGVPQAELAAWKRAHQRARRPVEQGAGRPLEEVTDPFALKVHRPITPGDHAAGGRSRLAELPAYVPRAHDAELADVVGRAAAGTSGMVVLVAGSSSGKTRACWEALEGLRQEGGWRLWHPPDPNRPGAALAELERVAPYTVVWLNESQEYLGGEAGERVAAGLRTLLGDAGRGPVLVLGTLWPEHHQELTARSGSPVTQLLDGRVIEVPQVFAGADLDAVRAAAERDPYLRQALERADDQQITQYLAGGPALIERLGVAPEGAKQVMWAAMDARRLQRTLPKPSLGSLR
ncbi:helix-turn-helix domain-containing protein [Actinomadura sp. 6N118]|uniref:helix-turn-helix domain-containing protein n=1 Tax=Actinomadura sp. 6N118 TaxID=3375151 RepID=UPI00379D4EDF